MRYNVLIDDANIKKFVIEKTFARIRCEKTLNLLIILLFRKMIVIINLFQA